MLRVSPLQNSIQHYAWGSRTALAELQGRPTPSPEPEAELWLGAHPVASSRALVRGESRSMMEIIERDPEGLLGRTLRERMGPRLPFLLKVLAVESPLSLQAHPTRDQARAGFAHEESLGIPLDAPERSYRDADHKPEMVCALTRFQGLKGFRPPRDILADLQRLAPRTLAREIRVLSEATHAGGWRRTFESLLTSTLERKAQVVAETRERAAAADLDPHRLAWLEQLCRSYPRDVGALAPIFLHLVTLEPGEALFLRSQELHCYLQGVAIEIMAASDNVLRGGLTQKHVDVDGLLGLLRFEASDVVVLRPGPRMDGVWSYPIHAEEFGLDEIRLREGASCELLPEGPEILICVDGEGVLHDVEASDSFRLRRGESVFVAARVALYRLQGPARIFRARVPAEGEAPKESP